jgi:hypothetical protein
MKKTKPFCDSLQSGLILSALEVQKSSFYLQGLLYVPSNIFCPLQTTNRLTVLN